MPKRKPASIAETKAMPWSGIGNTELDAAAETLFNTLREENTPPYHLQPSQVQERAQRAVIDLLGTAVPTLLRTRAKEYDLDEETTGDAEALRNLAAELESDHR